MILASHINKRCQNVHDSRSQWEVNKDSGPLAKSIIHPFNLLCSFVVKRQDIFCACQTGHFRREFAAETAVYEVIFHKRLSLLRLV